MKLSLLVAAFAVAATQGQAIESPLAKCAAVNRAIPCKKVKVKGISICKWKGKSKECSLKSCGSFKKQACIKAPHCQLKNGKCGPKPGCDGGVDSSDFAALEKKLAAALYKLEKTEAETVVREKALKAELAKLQEELAVSEKEREDVDSSDFAALEKELAAALYKLEKKEAEKTTLKAELAKLEENAEELESIVADAESKLAASEKERKVVEHGCHVMEKKFHEELAISEMERKEAELECQAIEDALQEKLAKTSAHVEELESIVADAELKLAESEKERDMAEHECRSIQDALHEELVVSKTIKAQLEEELHHFKAALNDCQNGV